MAESLQDLGESFAWTPEHLPRGECLVVSDELSTEGTFWLHHFVSLFLKAKARVCVVSLTHTYAHYNAIGRKLGVSIDKAKMDKRFRFIDCLKHPTLTLDRKKLQHQIRDFLDDASTLPTCLIIDDMQALEAIVGRLGTLDFYRACRAFVAREKGHNTLITLYHRDAEEDDHTSLGRRLVDLASVTIEVRGLESGFVSDIHGEFEISRLPRTIEKLVSPQRFQYKLMENGITSFRVGEAKLRT